MTTSSERVAPVGPAEVGSRGRARPAPMLTTVRRTQQLSPTMVRIVLGGAELARFTPNAYSDAYVKLVFAKPGAISGAGSIAPQDRPPQRTYTVRAWDQVALELTIDFVVHGDEGLAGPWAASARPGDEMLVMGPGGGYAPEASAAWHLMVGDESALPAIAASLEQLPQDAIGHVLLEVHDASQQQELAAPAGIKVRWVHQGDRPLGQGLVEAVAGLDFPVGEVHAFVHGEAGAVKELRRVLRQQRGVPLANLSISGYWRLGADDETWRSVKRAWNQEIEQAESQTSS